MKNFQKKISGSNGEQKVCDWLITNGYTIIARNFSHKIAEVDIIALHPNREIISFVEVRTRQNTTLGHPLETITTKKQSHIRKAAELYLIQHKITNIAVQFDVATIVWETSEFQYIPNAF